ITVKRYEIEHAGREVLDDAALLMRDVARHGQGLEVHFWSHHGRAEVQQHAAFQSRYRLCEDEEITVTRRSERGAVAVGVFVNDGVPDPDMNRQRNSEPNCRGQNAHLAMRKAAVENGTAQ